MPIAREPTAGCLAERLAVIDLQFQPPSRRLRIFELLHELGARYMDSGTPRRCGANFSPPLAITLNFCTRRLNDLLKAALAARKKCTMCAICGSRVGQPSSDLDGRRSGAFGGAGVVPSGLRIICGPLRHAVESWGSSPGSRLACCQENRRILLLPSLEAYGDANQLHLSALRFAYRSR